LLVICSSSAFAQNREGPIRFRVTLAPEFLAGTPSGRLIIFLAAGKEAKAELRRQPGEISKSLWMGAEEVELRPGESLLFDPDRLAWPTPFSQAPPGNYEAMAVLDVNHHYAYNGLDAGDLRSDVLSIRNLNPKRTVPVALVLNRRVPDKKISVAAGAEAFDFVSPLLTAFWGRTIHMRGIVVLPPGYTSSTGIFPAVYLVGGFTDDLASLAELSQISAKGMLDNVFPAMVHVIFDESCPGGAHEFADSVNNGPWGRALTEELIPYLESKYRISRKGSERFLAGHSSGGWAALWLQVRYPQIFGGAWPTAPDPSDFRYFMGANLYADPPENLYRNRDGSIRAEWVMAWAKQDRVLGEYGGQWSSYEWVFSPRGNDGRHQPLFDRDTGAIDPEVAKAWRAYDIAASIRKDADRLRPVLDGKIHLTVGAKDEFGPAVDRMLEETLKNASIRATFRYIEGRGHFDLDPAGWAPVHGGLLEQIFTEMNESARQQQQ
jgi:S-formylglutathione hydrolase FrmB